MGLLLGVLWSEGYLCHSLFCGIDVLEDAAFVILGSQLSLKIFRSLPQPQHVSCNELGAKCC